MCICTTNNYFSTEFQTVEASTCVPCNLLIIILIHQFNSLNYYENNYKNLDNLTSCYFSWIVCVNFKEKRKGIGSKMKKNPLYACYKMVFICLHCHHSFDLRTQAKVCLIKTMLKMMDGSWGVKILRAFWLQLADITFSFSLIALLVVHLCICWLRTPFTFFALRKKKSHNHYREAKCRLH